MNDNSMMRVLLSLLVVAIAALQPSSAHVGSGMPVHGRLHPRHGISHTPEIPYQVVRRSIPSRRNVAELEAGIKRNIQSAVGADFGDDHKVVFAKRASNPHGTTEESASKLTSETEECTPYSIPAITKIKDQFPTVWEVADILPADDEARNVLQAINSSGIVPAGIAPRGTPPASYSGKGLDGNYDIQADPDCWWTDKQCTMPKHKGLLPDVVSCPEPQTWGYTFDDGPNCTHNALYDMWAENNQKASLMYIGSNVFDWPLEAQRGIVDGHHICVHTWSHRYMTALTDTQVFAELWYTMKAIKYIMGVTPTCWRPPYGDVDDRVRAFAQGLGLRNIMWNVDTNDWNIEPYGTIPTPSMRATYSSIMSLASQPSANAAGIIVLEHELESSAMNMTIEQYPAVKKAWKNVVPLTACLNITNPYPEDVVYPDFAEYVAGAKPSGLPDSSMSISESAALTAQGTLSGMGSMMATASNGAGNSIATQSLPTSTAASQDAAASSNDSKSKSSSASAAFHVNPAMVLVAMLCFGAFMAL